MILLQGLGYFPVSLYMPTYTSALGLPPLNGSLVLAMFNLLSVLGISIQGSSHHRTNRCWVHVRQNAVCTSHALFRTLQRHCSIRPLRFRLFPTPNFRFRRNFRFSGISNRDHTDFQAGGFSSIMAAAAVETSEGDPSLRAPVFLGLAWSRGIAAIVGPIIAGSLYDRSRDKESRLYGGHGFINVTIFVGVMMFATGFLGAGTSWWKNHRV